MWNFIVCNKLFHLKFVKAVQDSYEDRKYGKVTKMNQLLRQMGANMNMRYLQLERFLSMIGMFMTIPLFQMEIIE